MSKKTKKNRKRASMGAGTRKAAQAAKTGITYLDIPSGLNMFKEEAGSTHLIDIVPFIVGNVSRHPEAKYIPEDIWWRMPYKVHKNVGPNKASVLCPTTIGKPCPICEERQAIFDDPDSDDEMAKALKASKRSLYAVVLKGKKATGEPMLWDISDYCFRDMLDTELNCGEEDWGDFPNLEGGYTLKVRMAEESFGGNKFAMCDRIDFKERDDYDEEILDQVPALDDLLSFLSYDKIYNIFQGIDEDEVVDKEEEAEEETPKKKTRKKAKPEPEPEEVDEDEEDEDEDEEEPEPPRKKKSAKKKPEPEPDTEDVEEDDSDDSEDVDEVEPPKKEKKATAMKRKNRKVKDEGCPFGHKFGDDLDEYDDCDDCVQFDNCLKKSEED